MSNLHGRGVGPGGRFKPTHSQRQVALYHEQQQEGDPLGHLSIPEMDFEARPFETWLKHLLHDLHNNNPAITRVHVTIYGDVAACALAAALEGNVHVTEWDLSNSQLSDTGARAAAAVMQPGHNRTVAKLVLHSNNINYTGCHALAHGLRRNSSLRELNLSKNNIGDGGLQALAAGFAGEPLNGEAPHPCPIEVLDVSRNSIADIGAEAFFRLGLVPNQTLRVMQLSRNAVSDASAAAIASALACPTVALEELRLDTNRLSDAGCCAIARALCGNSRLRVLSLDHNSVGDEGAEQLGRALLHNHQLRELHLASNFVTDHGARFLAESLAKPHGHFESGVQVHALSVLDLGDNKLLDDGAMALAAALRKNRSLTELGLRSNKIKADACHQLADALRENCTLTDLDLDLNQVTTHDAIRIFVPVLAEVNQTIKFLKCGANIAHSCKRERERTHFPITQKDPF
eukprot:g6374.t1